jgi:hypothetical protein
LLKVNSSLIPNQVEQLKCVLCYSSISNATIDSCNTCIVSFDLGMSRAGLDIFVLIVHFLNDKLELCHVIVGLFLKLYKRLEVPWLCK